MLTATNAPIIAKMQNWQGSLRIKIEYADVDFPEVMQSVFDRKLDSFEDCLKSVRLEIAIEKRDRHSRSLTSHEVPMFGIVISYPSKGF
jgi:hypothetical protein